MNFSLIHPGLIMTDYPTLRAGVDHFYNHSSQNLAASFAYKHTRHGLFANGMVTHTWSRLPYTMAQQLYGDYIVYSYSDGRSDSRTLWTVGSLGKTTQKVNLFEKVQIPGYQEAVRKIKRFMEDEENLSKSSQKILKSLQEARARKEEVEAV